MAGFISSWHWSQRYSCNFGSSWLQGAFQRYFTGLAEWGWVWLWVGSLVVRWGFSGAFLESGAFCLFVCCCLFSFWLPHTSLQWAFLEGPQEGGCVWQRSCSAQSSFLFCPQQCNYCNDIILVLCTPWHLPCGRAAPLQGYIKHRLFS